MSTTLDPSHSGTSLKTAISHTPHTSNGGGRVFLTVLVIGGLAAGGYFALQVFGSSQAQSQEYVLHEVKTQVVDIVVVERGSLESSKNVDLMCEVEARNPQSAATTILSIVKEGTHVSKGELLVELDSASLKDQITQQQIKVEQAKASVSPQGR